MRHNFNELFSKMKPEAQESVKAPASELLEAMALDSPTVGVSARLDNCVIRLDQVEASENQTPAGEVTDLVSVFNKTDVPRLP